MANDLIAQERALYKPLLLAISKSLYENDLLSEELIKNNTTKICKLICRLADDLNLPLTRSWYRHGEYPYLEGLNINLDRDLIVFKGKQNELSKEQEVLFTKAYSLLKKISIESMFKKSTYLFLEEYYLDPKFNNMRFIKIYRTFFQLNKFIETEFKPLIMNYLKPKIDGKALYYLNDEEIINKEFDQDLKIYNSKSKTLKKIFGDFLFEITSDKYDFDEELVMSVYEPYNLFELLCLKIDFLASKSKLQKEDLNIFVEVHKKMIKFWQILAAHISTIEHKGLREEELIREYSKKKMAFLKKYPSQFEDEKGTMVNNNLLEIVPV